MTTAIKRVNAAMRMNGRAFWKSKAEHTDYQQFRAYLGSSLARRDLRRMHPNLAKERITV